MRVAFDTSPIPFAVRQPLPGTDLDAGLATMRQLGQPLHLS